MIKSCKTPIHFADLTHLLQTFQKGDHGLIVAVIEGDNNVKERLSRKLATELINGGLNQPFVAKELEAWSKVQRQYFGRPLIQFLQPRKRAGWNEPISVYGKKENLSGERRIKTNVPRGLSCTYLRKLKRSLTAKMWSSSKE